MMAQTTVDNGFFNAGGAEGKIVPYAEAKISYIDSAQTALTGGYRAGRFKTSYTAVKAVLALIGCG